MRDFYDVHKRELFIRTLYEALTKVGFFAVRHTGVDRHIIHEAYNQAEMFFNQCTCYKEKYRFEESKGLRGFFQSEIGTSPTLKDFKEFYQIGPAHGYARNFWPDQDGFKEGLVTLYNELAQYVIPLQEAIVETLNAHISTKLPLHFLNTMTKDADTLLRAYYYPSPAELQLNESEQPPLWAASHTDMDLLAILPYATEKGLQVEVNGQWLNVIVPEDAFIVNAGDMLENMTNGLFISARHRVVSQEPNKERFSMVLFVNPRPEIRLDPLQSCIDLTGGVQRYANGTCREFSWERLLELDLAPSLLSPYAQTGHIERQIRYGRASERVIEMLIEQQLASAKLLELIKSPS